MDDANKVDVLMTCILLLINDRLILCLSCDSIIISLLNFSHSVVAYENAKKLNVNESAFILSRKCVFLDLDRPKQE